MPYMPTSMYPRNCAVEMTEDGYTFLATIDDQDYIEKTELNLFDRRGNKIGSINDIDKKLNWSGAKNPVQINNDFSAPPYHRDNEIIKYTLPKHLNIETTNANSYILQVDSSKKCRLFARTPCYKHSNSTIYIKSQGDKTETTIFTKEFLSEESQGSLYKFLILVLEIPFKIVDKNNQSKAAFSVFFDWILSSSDVNFPSSTKIPQTQSKYLKLNTSIDSKSSSAIKIDSVGSSLLFFGTANKEHSWGDYYFNDFGFNLCLSNCKIKWNSQEFYLNDIIECYSVPKLYYHSDIGFWDNVWENLTDEDTENTKLLSEKLLQLKQAILYEKNNYNEYFSLNNDIIWNLRLFDKDNFFKRYVSSGILEKHSDNNNQFLITPIEQIKNEDDVKNFRINKESFSIIESTYYYHWTEVCNVTQTKLSETSYEYIIHKDGMRFEELLDGLNKTQLALFIGTVEFNSIEFWEEVDGNFTESNVSDIVFESPLVLITDTEKGSSTSLQIAINIERMGTVISFKNSSFALQQDIVGSNYDVYCNFLDSNSEQFSIVEKIDGIHSLSFENRRIFSELSFNTETLSNWTYFLKSCKFELYENKKRISSFTIFSPSLDFVKKYKYNIIAKPGAEYYGVCYITFSNGLQKVFKSLEEIFDSDNKIKNTNNLFLDGLNNRTYLYLSSILGLPYYNSSTQELMWTNRSGEVWTDQEIVIDTNSMAIMSLRASVYRNTYKDKVEIYHDEFWGIDNQQIQKNNEIEESILILDNKELFPISSNNYDNTLYDYGITKGKSYDYEIYYEADVVDYLYEANDVSWLTYELASPEIGPIYLTYPVALKMENYYDGGKDGTNYPYIGATLKDSSFKEILNFNLVPHYNSTEKHFSISGDFYNSISDKTESLSADVLLNEENGEIISILGGFTEVKWIETRVKKELQDVSYTIQLPPIKTNIITTDDWMGVSLYGTNYIYDENKENRYELNPNQVWYFDLDTKADSIDFTNERNVFVNASSLPKVGISNVNYMTQSITSKLGYLTEVGEYIEDTKNRLDKFVDFSQDGTVKILRLRNGYLIPVDIAVKSNAGNYTVVGEPSDITFTWTQVGDHKNCVLYSLEQGVKY